MVLRHLSVLVGLRSAGRDRRTARAFATVALLAGGMLFPAATSAQRQGQTSPPADGIALRMIPQPAAPAMLVQMSYGFPDAVREGAFRNLSESAIASVRIGQVAVDRQGVQSAQVGRVMALPAQPGHVVRFDSPGVGHDFTKMAGLASLEFYVAEVTFADGEVWREDGSTLRRPFAADRGRR